VQTPQAAIDSISLQERQVQPLQIAKILQETNDGQAPLKDSKLEFRQLSPLDLSKLLPVFKNKPLSLQFLQKENCALPPLENFRLELDPTATRMRSGPIDHSTISKNKCIIGAIIRVIAGLALTILIYEDCTDNALACVKNFLTIGSIFIIGPSLLLGRLIRSLSTADNVSSCYKKIKECMTKFDK